MPRSVFSGAAGRRSMWAPIVASDWRGRRRRGSWRAVVRAGLPGHHAALGETAHDLLREDGFRPCVNDTIHQAGERRVLPPQLDVNAVVCGSLNGPGRCPRAGTRSTHLGTGAEVIQHQRRHRRDDGDEVRQHRLAAVVDPDRLRR